MTRELICIICPRGCSLKAELKNGKCVSVEGNTCKRGEEYARTECCNPKRTVTSTMRCTDGRLVSVKTSRPIAREKVFACMEVIGASVCSLPVHIGEVLVKDVFGCNIVATANVEKE